MLNASLIILCLVFCAAAIWYELINRKLRDKLQIVSEKSDKVFRSSLDAIKEAQSKIPYAVTIEAFRSDDPDYIRVLSEIFSRPEVEFFIEDLRYSVSRALVQANDEVLEKNAIGKLKGIELVAREMKRIIAQASEAA
jgi:hypothetical protein